MRQHFGNAFAGARSRLLLLGLSLLLLTAVGGCAKRAPVPALRQPPIQSPIRGFSKWLQVCEREQAAPSFSKGQAATADAKAAQAWAGLRAQIKDSPRVDQLRAVHGFFNAWPYREDRDVWGMEDYWATPGEFMERSGDCEDYVIAKYFALRDLGLPAEDLRIAGVWNLSTNQGHALLLVKDGEKTWALDNLTAAPVPAEVFTQYVPRYYANEQYMWTYTAEMRRSPRCAGAENL
jgi:predicted transglutaminase-like cysteine proteinase